MKQSSHALANLRNKIVLVLAVLAAAMMFTGCPQPQVPTTASIIPGQPISTFVGTWESNAGGYHSEYAISSSVIDDSMSGCVFNIVSESTVLSADGYTLIFTQCSQGTMYTPDGYYYVVAVKQNSSNSIDISCPVDYNDRFTSLSQLQKHYTSSYGVVAAGNWTSTCTRVGGDNSSSVTVTDDSWYMSSQCVFSSDSVVLSQMGISGFVEYDSFTPTRDTSKENGNILLYLYDSTERYYGTDLHYCAVKNENGTYKVYWYIYDEDEDDNDSMVESIYPDYMPTVTSANLQSLQNMYQ